MCKNCTVKLNIYNNYNYNVIIIIIKRRNNFWLKAKLWTNNVMNILSWIWEYETSKFYYGVLSGAQFFFESYLFMVFGIKKFRRHNSPWFINYFLHSMGHVLGYSSIGCALCSHNSSGVFTIWFERKF